MCDKEYTPNSTTQKFCKKCGLIEKKAKAKERMRKFLAKK